MFCIFFFNDTATTEIYTDTLFPYTTLFRSLIDRTARALGTIDGATALVVAGGVAANTAVRGALETLAADHALRFVAPPGWLCTDNAAMIAWAGAERFAAGLTDPLDTRADRKSTRLNSSH